MKTLMIVTSSYAANSTDAASGAGLFVRDFARCIAETSVGVCVVTQGKSVEVHSDRRVEIISCPWRGGGRPAVELSLRRPRDLLHAASLLYGGVRAIRHANRRLRPDRCLCMWAVPCGAMAMWALRSTGVHYDAWCLGSDIWRYGRPRATRWIVRTVLRNASLLLADGPTLARESARLAGRACRFLPSARLIEGTRPAPTSLAEGKANLLFVGRFHPNKGVDLLPQTVALLRDWDVDAHLHIFGGGLLEADVRRLIAEHDVGDRVSFYGYCDADTVASYMRDCDVLIIPSRIESIPVVFSDAAACGIPVAATDVGDLGAMVRRYGVGETCAPGRPEELARAVRRVLDGDRASYRSRAAVARALFDIRRIARDYLDLAAA